MTTAPATPALKKMCLHKRTYATRALAKQMARRTGRAKGSRRHHCDVYQCSHCGFWHVTGRLNTQRRASYERSSEV